MFGFGKKSKKIESREGIFITQSEHAPPPEHADIFMKGYYQAYEKVEEISKQRKPYHYLAEGGLIISLIVLLFNLSQIQGNLKTGIQQNIDNIKYDEARLNKIEKSDFIFSRIRNAIDEKPYIFEELFDNKEIDNKIYEQIDRRIIIDSKYGFNNINDEINGLKLRVSENEERLYLVNNLKDFSVISISGRLGMISDKREKLPFMMKKYNPIEPVIVLNLDPQKDRSICGELRDADVWVSIQGRSRNKGCLVKIVGFEKNSFKGSPDIIGVASSSVFKKIGYKNPMIQGSFDAEVLILCKKDIIDGLKKWDNELIKIPDLP